MIFSHEILDDIAADNRSGASAIYSKAVVYFKAVLRERGRDTDDSLDAAIVASGRALIGAQPEMAPLYNLAASVLSAARAGSDRESVHDRVNALLDQLPLRLSESAKKLTEQAVKHVPEGSTILTISSSSAVRELIICHPARDSLTVIVPESRPMCEGIQLARALGKEGISTVLTTDFAACRYIDSSDLFICGADAVTENYLVNKVGTACILKIMMDSGKTSLALFTQEKIIRGDLFEFAPHLHAGSEITDEIIPRCSVENHYFEKCPIGNFTMLLSNDGPVSVDSLRNMLCMLEYPSDLA